MIDAQTLPILYSFRRCPYAIRARLALVHCQTPVALREIVLKHKPEHMLEHSPKGTVPVLITQEGQVIDESLDVMYWAIAESGDKVWWTELSEEKQQASLALIDENDGSFKHYLDRYKYFDRFPEATQLEYREQAEKFLAKLECMLKMNPYLLGANATLADVAIFPFIRQFAHVDKDWFFQSSYRAVQHWLETWLNSELFLTAMKKYKPFLQTNIAVPFPESLFK